MEEKKLSKNFNKNKIIIGIIILVAIIIIIMLLNSNSKVKSHHNISNLGMVTSGDDCIFYVKQNVGIIKIKDKKEYQISDGLAYSLWYENGYLYYLTNGNNGNVQIRRLRENGDDEVVLAEVTTPLNKMYLENGYLYYTTSNPNTISRMDLRGEKSNIVITRTVSDFEVNNGMVYFTDEAGYLYKVSVESKNYGSIGDKVLAKKVQIFENYAYYYCETNKSLMRMRLDGKSEDVVSNKVNCDIFNITDKNIYYLDIKTKTICSISMDGKKQKELVKVNTDNTKINIDGDVLYYTNTLEGSNSYRTFRIKTNGKSAEEIKY